VCQDEGRAESWVAEEYEHLQVSALFVAFGSRREADRLRRFYSTAALAQLRALGGGATTEAAPTAATTTSPSSQKGTAPTASVTDCCICAAFVSLPAYLALTEFIGAGLYPVTVCQSLFIAPCSHVTVSQLRSSV
jgi:hypothetical protein